MKFGSGFIKAKVIFIPICDVARKEKRNEIL